LTTGELLELKRESENSYDGNAILVLDNRVNKLGYVPAVRNKRLARKLDAGDPIITILLQVDVAARINQLHIEVFERGA